MDTIVNCAGTPILRDTRGGRRVGKGVARSAPPRGRAADTWRSRDGYIEQLKHQGGCGQSMHTR